MKTSHIIYILLGFCSACGLGALQLLFEIDKMESKETLAGIVDTLKDRLEDSKSCTEATKCNSMKVILFNTVGHYVVFF